MKVAFHFDHAPITLWSSEFYSQFVRLNVERPAFGEGGVLLDDPRELTSNFLAFGYNARIDRRLNPLAFSARLEFKNQDEEQFQDEAHARLEATLSGAYSYERGKDLRYRLFAGYFLRNENRESSVVRPNSFALVDNYASDYRYDGLFLGRNRDGLYEQQLAQRQGGFRAPIGPAFNFGRSNNFLTAANLDVELPKIPLLGVFADAGLYSTKAVTNEPLSTEFRAVAGVSLTALDGQIGLFLPLLADPDTRELLEQRGNLVDRLSFRLSLTELLPWRWLDGLDSRL